MTYFVSDIHGEYELFCALLKKIHFSESDTMYVCGDIGNPHRIFHGLGISVANGRESFL